MNKPKLFGINKSNRDFTKKETWGKNQFNSSFPVSLACYMYKKGIEAVYLKLNDDLKIQHSTISTEKLFGISPYAENLFFAFESDFIPYQSLVIDNVPRVDLVTQNTQKQICLRGIEIKLTALPDNATCELSDTEFGSELVIRPDSIVYLALSIANYYRHNTELLQILMGNTFKNITDWSDGQQVIHYLPKMIICIEQILQKNIDKQEPFIMQPIWKTLGKSPQLAENCLDIFVWSNLAFSKLFMNVITQEFSYDIKITRQLRSIIWLIKMLLDFCENKIIDYKKIIDELSYNTKNDKAFSVNGKLTHAFMQCEELTNPRIKKEEIKNIILGNGHLLLSPERRFDAIIYNSPDLFK